MRHIVKRDESELREFIEKQRAQCAAKLEEQGLTPEAFMSTELGFILSFLKHDEKPIELDLHQARFLTARSRFRSQLKARQVGSSFISACESLARTHLKEKHTSVFVSYNLDDAKEKILFVREMHEDLPLSYQKKIVTDSKTEIAFQSNSVGRRVSRILSNPAKAPRGKSGDIYLDELAHAVNDRTIYAGSTALITRSGGQLSMLSSPLGRRGVFWEIHSEELKAYPQFWRQEIPWWLARVFCRDVQGAAGEARDLPTEERVHRFGTDVLIAQFQSLPTEDFQQEYECIFNDESVSFFPYDIILPCAEVDPSHLLYQTAKEFAARATGRIVAGYDVGRMTNPAELIAFEREGEDRFIMRYHETLRRATFKQQKERLRHFIDSTGDALERLSIDATGMGRDLAETLRGEYGSKIETVFFTDQNKERMAITTKMAFQDRRLVLPRSRNLISQIHSVKQRITASGNTVFAADRSRKHHADIFWALALALKKGRRVRKPRQYEVTTVKGTPADDIEKDIPGDTLTRIFDTAGKLTRHEIARAAEIRRANDEGRIEPEISELLKMRSSLRTAIRFAATDEDRSTYKRTLITVLETLGAKLKERRESTATASSIPQTNEE